MCARELVVGFSLGWVCLQVLDKRFDMSWSIPDLLMGRRRQWLGHVGCIDGEKLPKRMCLLS